jgi:hypothetical protein
MDYNSHGNDVVLLGSVYLYVDAKVSEKYTVSIFRAGVPMMGNGGIYIGLWEVNPSLLRNVGM